MIKLTVVFFGIIFSLVANAAINISSWQNEGLSNWEHKEFSGNTIYSINKYKQRFALKAISNDSASGLVLTKKIDLLKTPYLNWSWLAEKKLIGLEEQTKSGDDFIARIYVVIDGGFFVWKTKSLNYVWSSNQEPGMLWDNPFASSNVKMMSLRGIESKTGQWYFEKRHVYHDLIASLGDKGSEQANQKAYQYIDVIAIMSDSDNSAQATESYYGDVIFTEK
jgi:hypothetical protein